MRRVFLAVIAVFLILVLPGASQASEGFEDLVKLARSGVSGEILLSYINNSPIAYDLSVDEILYLRDLGLSSEVITAVVDHGKHLGISAPVPVQTEEQAFVPAPASSEVVQETVVDAPVVTAPPQDSVDYSTFYDALSPYGTWIDVDGAWYWQPTAEFAVRGWRPYCDSGHWVYTDLGWMWQSSYSWGWAPFHYGRWRMHKKHGWIWQPDSVWAPAWVTWRQCDTDIGWAPLPPEAYFAPDTGFTYLGRSADGGCEFGLEYRQYAFVPALDFCSTSLSRQCLPEPNVAVLFGRTAVIRNGLAFANNRLANHGPPLAFVRERTHQDITQIRVVDSTVQPGGRIVSGIISGESVTMYRPHVAPLARETPRAVVALRQTSAELRHEQANKVAAIRMYKSPSETKIEQTRGSTSLRATGRPAVPVNPPQAVAPKTSQQAVAPRNPPQVAAPVAATHVSKETDQQKEALLAATRRRQAEETAEKQRQAEKQRAEALAHSQELQRQQAVAVQKNQAAAEQQHRAEQSARDQELQRQQAVEAQKNQATAEQQHRAEQSARDQQQKQKAAQQQQEQLKVFQAQRQAEETAARLGANHQQQVDNSSHQQSVLREYGNPATTNGTSSRGFDSRGKSQKDR